MAQSDVDALGQEVDDIHAQLQAEVDSLQAQIDAGQPVDLSGLKAKLDALKGITPGAGNAPADPTV